MAIRAPSTILVDRALTKGKRIATPGDVGHWLAMTVETLKIPETTRLPSLQKCRLFYKRYEPVARGAVSMSPAEAVLATSHGCMEKAFAFWRKPEKLKLTARRRAGLNRVNCTNANS